MKHFIIAVLAIFWSFAAHATTYSATFTFTNFPTSASSGLVTGIVEGLTDNATVAATSVRVISNASSTGFGVGEYVLPGAARENSFTMVNGFVTRASFISNTTLATTPIVGGPALSLATTTFIFGSPGAGLRSDVERGREQINIQSQSNLQFAEAMVVAPVPVPASGILLGAALVGTLVMRRKRSAS